jgi:hypothetical protein
MYYPFLTTAIAAMTNIVTRSSWFAITNQGFIRREELEGRRDALREGLLNENVYGFGKGRITIKNKNPTDHNDTFNVSAYKTQRGEWFLGVRRMGQRGSIRFAEWNIGTCIMDTVACEIQSHLYEIHSSYQFVHII